MKKLQPEVHALLLAALALMLVAPPATAHLPDHDAVPTLATAVTMDPWLVGALLAAAALYAVGVARLWRTTPGAGVQASRVVAFGTGLALLVVALVWPLDVFGEWSLAAHMAQHMVLMAAAPPLLVAGLPGAVCLAALPAAFARRAAGSWRHVGASPAWRALTRPGTAMLVQWVVVWGWHAPAIMDLALRNDAVHYAMHASFLAAGLLFWHALHRAVREPGAGFGAAAVALAGTMIQMGLLSALLTFGPTSRYLYYADRVPHLGLTPLEDQQLAGLIMWVPGAVPYLLGTLVLAAAWLRRSERLDRRVH